MENRQWVTSNDSNTITVTLLRKGLAMRITGFALMNTETRQSIRALLNNDILYLGDLPTDKLNIRANTNPDVIGRVEFVWNDGLRQIERNPPYAARAKRDIPLNEPGFLGPDGQNRTYAEWTPTPGEYSFVATPFAAQQGGEAGQPVERRFVVSPGSANDMLTTRELAELFGGYPDNYLAILMSDGTVPRQWEVRVRRGDAMVNRTELRKKS